MRISLAKIADAKMVAIGLILIFTSTVAHAGAFNMGGLTATLSTDHVTQSEASRAANQQVLSGSGFASQSAAEMDFTYRYSENRTRRNLDTFVDRSPSPEARADLQRIISAQPGLMSEIRASASSYGFDPNNVADTYAMWWINAWLVANKRDEDPDSGTIAMVRQQARSALAASTSFADTSDADRQQYAEALLLQAVLLGSAFEQWQGDPAMLDQLAQAARQGARASGLDLSAMTLGPNGFVPAGGALSSASPDDASVQLASAKGEIDSESDEGSSGLSIALATGAGLTLLALGALAYRRMS